MPVAITSGVPAIIQIGSTSRFTLSVSGYTSPTWTARLLLSRDGTPLASYTATGSGFDIIIGAGDALIPGPADYAIKLSDTGGDVLTYQTGRIFLAPDPEQVIPTTQAALALIAINAAITSGATIYSSGDFNGQSVNFRSLTEMMDARDRMQQIVDAELAALGLSNNGGGKRRVTRFI